jgi:alpha-L-glutamate ligase-like protein
MRLNDRSLYPLVDDKVRCKRVLEARGMPVPGLISQISYSGQSNRFYERLEGREQFVIKPAHGSGGDGVLVIVGQRGERYLSSSGRLWGRGEIAHYLTNVISGLYSLAGQPDTAMMEELVEFDPVFEHIAFQGVPDIRVIVYRGVPVMAMVRLPTRASDGKANLHQGAIGAGISIASGNTVAAVIGNHHVTEHVDTGASLLDFLVPQWEKIVSMAAHCADAVALGYLGVDIVLDRGRGPLILELNARPGLNIQIANDAGLSHRLRKVEESRAPDLPADERAAWAREAFS